MLYLITVVISLLIGFSAGALFYRKNGSKVANIEAKVKDAYDNIKN